jgi:tetratricopeptide (TPR) repeat protein
MRSSGAYLDAARAQSAILEYEETIALKPDYSAAHRELGRALQLAGRRNEAQAACRKRLAMTAHPGDPQTKKEIEVFLHRLDTAGS